MNIIKHLLGVIATGASIFIILFILDVNAQSKAVNISNTVTLSGDLLKACMVAYSDFSSKIKDNLSLPDLSEQLKDHMSKIENYDVKITTNAGTYTIRFSPKVSEKWRIFGGAATYTVRKSDFTLIGKLYEK